MKKQAYKIITFIPQTHLEQIRIAICDAGAGKIGKYDSCTFMSSGIGSYRPLKGSKPYEGEENKLQRSGEAKLETFVDKKNLEKVIKTIRKFHPYEEPLIEVYNVTLR
ncbi:hypothetical protein ACFLZ2_00855 [Candidatus Margulisiibacteriota bacterium]